MPKYRVLLKRVVYAEILVDAESAKVAREMVAVDPHEWFLSSEIGGTDTTTIASVKPEKQ